MLNKFYKYSFKKCRHILNQVNNWYQKKGDTLSPSLREELEKDLYHLDQALLEKDKDKANHFARKLEQFSKEHCKKSTFQFAKEMVIALVLALAIATVVRQMWFEIYEIPTGSMRPTFKEKDDLTVSKLSFGINIPLQTQHFYFDPNLTQRTSVLIFSGDKIPFIDQTTYYFNVLPYTKRYIKRLIGKPGDTLYFYGGKIYGIDKEGHEIKELLDSPYMKGLEHIPFITFEGYISSKGPDRIVFHQMYQPLGMLSLTYNGNLSGQIYNGKEWVREDLQSLNQPHDSVKAYADFYGIKNFAMARLLTKEELQFSEADSKGLPDAPLYLELRHTPTLKNPKIQKFPQGYSILLKTAASLIPLQQQHLDAIMQHMYTARFVIDKGVAYNYSIENVHSNREAPKVTDIPDGTYEFYFGKASKIGFGGIASDVDASSPLYNHDPKNVQFLYNLGIRLDKSYIPQNKNQITYPQRYAYFKDGDLYLLNAPILKKEDPTLADFLKREEKSETPFKDFGPPKDKDFIKTFGVHIPEKHYLVLGDNHAMSGDSREFGFVPEANLQGAPSLIIWPPGDRMGRPMQKPYPIFNLPRIIIWSLALVILGTWYMLHRRKVRTPVFKALEK
jgi:signal peptidase I